MRVSKFGLPLVAPAMLLIALPAWADQPGPVCAQPLVLQRISDILRRAGQNTIIEPGAVGQAPLGGGKLVSCAVRTRTLYYDTPIAAYAPLERTGVFTYTLELRRNGVFLTANQGSLP